MKKRHASKKAKRGYYTSTKTGSLLKYRSSWERSVFEYLDICADVLHYDYEPFGIEYSMSKRDKTTMIHTYIPDLLIFYTDGTRKLIEVKPKSRLNEMKNQRKFEAANDFCIKNNIEYEIWTDKKIDDIKKIISANTEVAKRKSSSRSKSIAPEEYVDVDDYASLSTLYESGFAKKEICAKYNISLKMLNVILKNNSVENLVIDE